MPAIFWLIQSAFRLVGWHFLPDEDGKMAETISIVPLSLSFRDPYFGIWAISLHYYNGNLSFRPNVNSPNQLAD